MNGSPSPARIAPRGEVLPDSTNNGFVVLDGEHCYRISEYDRIAPFLMSIPSDTDLWMFVASGGGLTAGRVDADRSIFPYETVDRLHDGHHLAGPITVIHVDLEDGTSGIWEPFANPGAAPDDVERFLYKNTTGNRVVFEEVHHGFGLSFRYQWCASDEFGWVRSCRLHNRGRQPASLRLMDGLRNIMPAGVLLALQQQSSNLVNAYKKSEIDPDTGLGIFSLTSKITDRTEALESLRANVVWSTGLDNPRHHLSGSALAAFRKGRLVSGEQVLNGARGNYLISDAVVLDPGAETKWHLVADAGLDHPAIAALRRQIQGDRDLGERIEASLRAATLGLRRNVGSADGIQLTGRDESWSHHFANVLFNNMRGGVFLHNYEVPRDDLARFIEVRNSEVVTRRGSTLRALDEICTIGDVLASARETGDADFERLCLEYLPLHFSRRHGDPSRPWNQFSIRVRDEAGGRELNYEGNWRDLFQNWEALARSFPEFLPSMISKFVNASTADGFNPYRVTREGVEWEVPNPEDPWSNIGYWGDHQIIYLLKLLESLDSFSPEALGELMGREIFSYVDLPYRIAPYDKLVIDPEDTIEFDEELSSQIEARVEQMGSDGRLIIDGDGNVHHVNLFEKLLVPVLSKLSNLVPGAGIWMNTQRPEWNDANNALGGGAASVVTLCYLRRHLNFLIDRFSAVKTSKLPVSSEVVEWLTRLDETLESHRELLGSAGDDPAARRALMDALGEAFCEYRSRVYQTGFTGKTDLDIERVVAFMRTAVEFVDASIAANRREDGLYHTYNRLENLAGGRGVEPIHLPEMLEGQVAALSSGSLAADEVVELLNTLFASSIYDPERKSFVLYPERELPGFLDRNVIPRDAVADLPLLGDLIAAGDNSLVVRDAEGTLRFNAEIESTRELRAALDKLENRAEWSESIRRSGAAVVDLFDDVFGHRAYTGRSGIMFGFEGIGCIYWHMVAKLLLAVQDVYSTAKNEGASAATLQALADLYYRVRAGIGYEKTAEEFGAFPTDPYSHTPSDGGARQPGMTGQVKEEILTRLGELGITVSNGTLGFYPSLLETGELVTRPAEFSYFDVDGEACSLSVPTGSLVFTYCQVPIVYESGTSSAWIRVIMKDGATTEIDGASLPPDLSREVFARSGRVKRIVVGIVEGALQV
jgi:hypothetical protein